MKLLLIISFTFNCDNLMKEVYKLSDIHYLECVEEQKLSKTSCDRILKKIDYLTTVIFKTCNIEVETC
jgi:hypothetical protein